MTVEDRAGAVDRRGSVDDRPNIVVVVVDDLRWDDVGAYGHPFVSTPNIDRIADEGVRFLNAFATTPLCSPSRGSILTGLYPHTNGIVDNTDRSARSHELDTFPLRLHEAGYETAFIGKWHMGNDETRRPGFDTWVSMKGQGEAIDPNLHEDGTTMKVEGYVTDLLTDRAVEFISRDRDSPFLLFLAHKALHPNVIQHDDGSVTAIGAGGFIPAERHSDLYTEELVPADLMPRRPSYGVPPRGKPALERTIGDLPPLGPGTVTNDSTIRDRLRMLMAVDEGLGRMLDALEEKDELDDTVVVVMSDHGYFYGEHGLSAERRLAYEETLRIPLLVRYPPLTDGGATDEPGPLSGGTDQPGALHPGATLEAMVLTIDLAPTLLELGQTESETPLHGRSLMPIFRGLTASSIGASGSQRAAGAGLAVAGGDSAVPTPSGWRTSFLVEYFSDTVFRRIVTMGYQAVRTERYKYIHYTELEGMDELYNLETDPYEMANVIDSPDYGSVLAAMREELSRLLRETR